MSEQTQAEKDAEFGAAVDRILKATNAVVEWEKAHGVVLCKAIRISCPCCGLEDTLRFARTKHHLYIECETPKCVPQSRANTRGCR